MKKFFDCIETLDRYTKELRLHEPTCPHCHTQGALISHGFVYKYIEWSCVVSGKRLFCSNRHQKKGCGRTIQLYIADFIPTLKYSVKNIFSFLTTLFSLFSIQHSYTAATQTNNPRNAYRWLIKLVQKIVVYRKSFKTHSSLKKFKRKVLRLQNLLPTIQTLFDLFGDSPIQKYQSCYHLAFI